MFLLNSSSTFRFIVSHLSLSLCHCFITPPSSLILSPSFSLSLSLSHTHSSSLILHLSIYIPLFLFLALSLSLPLPIPFSRILSLSLSHSLFNSFSLFIYFIILKKMCCLSTSTTIHILK